MTRICPDCGGEKKACARRCLKCRGLDEHRRAVRRDKAKRKGGKYYRDAGYEGMIRGYNQNDGLSRPGQNDFSSRPIPDESEYFTAQTSRKPNAP
jgi:hypothetical protein